MFRVSICGPSTLIGQIQAGDLSGPLVLLLWNDPVYSTYLHCKQAVTHALHVSVAITYWSISKFNIDKKKKR